jgi:hypothetical protein
MHVLPPFLRQLGYQRVHLMAHAFEFSTGTDNWSDQYHNIEVIGYQIKSFYVNLGLISPEDFDQLQQQALIDMQRETFYGMGHLTTVLGCKPSND